MGESGKMKVDSECAKFQKMANGLKANPHAPIKAKLEPEKEARRGRLLVVAGLSIWSFNSQGAERFSDFGITLG